VGRLEGKSCLISGGAKGLGAAQARLFAREGARVAVGDVLESEGARLVEELRASGADSLYVSLDVTSEADWQQAVRAVMEEFGALDVLVNNAGIYNRAPVEETTLEEWERVMDVNSTGVFLGTKHAIPAMRRSGGGSIVNMSSVAGLVGSRTQTVYNASKGAVRLLTKSTAVQYAPEGIRANSVHPGVIETDMMQEVIRTEEERATRMSLTPIGRFGTAEDVANGVLFLASDEASYVTGAELVIDGGLTVQ
jgi:3alpha(or 20beta)-hydroxysteroid dehydrogenase/cyclopentanol dehydrogenase